MADLICEFIVYGYCQPWQRPANRRFTMAQESRCYQQAVAEYAKIAMKGKEPYAGFIGAEIVIICEYPKKWPTKKKRLALEGEIFPTHCDVDNCVKNLFDAMNGIVYTDDRFINSLILRREYGPEDKVIVKIMGMPK